MKKISQIEAMKSVRKPATPPSRIQRPVKGGGYRRKKDWQKEVEA